MEERADGKGGELSSLLGPEPRVPVGQWTPGAHMKGRNAMHILLYHPPHKEEQLKDFTQGSNVIQMAFRKITIALYGRREKFLFKKLFSATAEGKEIQKKVCGRKFLYLRARF